MESIKIAVLNSDRSRSATICRALGSIGYQCEAFASAKKFQDGLHSRHIDLLIVGRIRAQEPAQIARSVRAVTQPEMPILLIAGNGDAAMIEQTLAAGATDYLCMPVRTAELKMRVGVMLARAYPERMALERKRYGDFEFDTHARQVKYAGEPVSLTRREFALALLLFQHLGQPLSRATIGETVWGEGIDVYSRTIDTHVSRVRSKLNLRPEYGYQLGQVYGYGYRLERSEEVES